MRKLTGHLKGLKAQQIQDAERLFRRRLPQESAAPPELMRELAEWSAAVGRRLAVLVDRRGQVLEVIVGDAHNLNLPTSVLTERGVGRFSGLRCISTGPFTDEPRQRDLETLLRARLDLYIQIAITDDGRPWSFREVSLRPDSPLVHNEQPKARQGAFNVSEPQSPREARTDFIEFITALEEELERGMPVSMRNDGTIPERAVLVTVGTGLRRPLERRQAELKELVRSAGAEVVGQILQIREAFDPKTLVGRGCVRDLALLCQKSNADLVVFSTELTATQSKALEDFLSVKIIDRTQLILDLFAQSARSSGGKVQVELARLRYLLPRLVGRGQGFSQVGGGIGSNRGVGEKKLELDRRSVRTRIGRLEKKYEKLLKRRDQKRRRRQRNGVKQISLVGYTNAGKSTLFNRLTGATVGTADRLFSTLDPTVRKRSLPSGQSVVFSDTVGFLDDLPADLVRAFGATLEELRETRVRVHVADASAPDVHLKIRAVRQLLQDLKLDQAPEVLVFNKCDLVDFENFRPLARRLSDAPILLSAKTGEGLAELTERIDRLLAGSTSQAA